MMETTLQVCGREKTKEVQETVRGKCFDVNPKSINRQFFAKERKNPKQECTRQMIVEAFTKVDEMPEKYAKPFKTMIPEKKWSAKKGGELKEIASSLGDHMADWVEQALEWAQRIANGETWETVCNEIDTENWYRLVIWKNGSMRLVGASCKNNDFSSASDVISFNFNSYCRLSCAVPLVVLYE